MGNDHEDRQQQQQRQPQNHPSPAQNTGASNDGNDKSSSVPSSSTVPNVAAASAPDGVTASVVARSNTSTTNPSTAVGAYKSLAIESSHANEAKAKSTSAVSSTSNQWSAQQQESRKDRKKDKKKKKRKKRSRKERDKEGGGDNDKKKSTTDETSSKRSIIKDDKTKVKASCSGSSMTATTSTASSENKGQEREKKRLKLMAEGSKDDVVARPATTKDKEKSNRKVSVAPLTEALSSTRMSNEKEVPKRLPHPTKNAGDNDGINKNAKLLPDIKRSTSEHASGSNHNETAAVPPEERVLHATLEESSAPAPESSPNHAQLTTALDHVCHFLQVPPLPSAESSFVISPPETTTLTAAVQEASTTTATGSSAAAVSSSSTTTTPLPSWMVDPSWDVTPYDIYRHPRKVECDGRKRLTLPLKQLNGEFCCVICLGYIRKTSIVMVCLHRFCAECIQKCLRLGKRECPTCRVHIPSRRSLRPDPNYDALIQTILGNVDRLEEQQQATITKINQTRHMNTSHTLIRQRHATLQQQKKSIPPSTSGGVSVTSTSSVTARSQQSQLQSERGGNNSTSGGSSKRRGTSSSGSTTSQDANQPRTEKGDRRGTSTTATTTAGQQQQPLLPHTIPPTTIENLQISPLVGFILRKDPQERRVSRLRKEFLRVHPAMTMWYIKEFLSRKLSSPWLLESSSYVGQIMWEPSHFQLLTLLDGQPMILKDTMTIGDVQEHMWDIHDEELIIHYRTMVVVSNKTNEEAQLSAAAASSQTVLSK